MKQDVAVPTRVRDIAEVARVRRQPIEQDGTIFDDIFARGRTLHDDPLQALLTGLKLLAEALQDAPSDQATRRLNHDTVLGWRRRFANIFADINARHKPLDPIDVDGFADKVAAIVDDGVILSRALKNAALLSQQILLLRSYVGLLYLPQAGDASPPPAKLAKVS